MVRGEIDYNELKGKTPEIDKIINTINLKKINGINTDDDEILLALMLMEYNEEFDKAVIYPLKSKKRIYKELKENLVDFKTELDEIKQNGFSKKEVWEIAYNIADNTALIAKGCDEYLEGDWAFDENDFPYSTDLISVTRYISTAEKAIRFLEEAIKDKNKGKMASVSCYFFWLGRNGKIVEQKK